MISSCMGSLMELADKDKNVLYLTADSGEGGLDLMFRRNFGDRAFDFGIAESNLVAAAAGMAAAGKIPFVYTAAPFLVYRACEFIRNDICLQNLPVKIIAGGSGLSVPALGPTHHTTEDLAVLLAMPNLTVLSPATPKEAYWCIRQAYEIDGPVYIRVAMNREKEYFDTEDYSGDGIDCVKSGDGVTIITTGSLISEVMDAAGLLENEGISAKVIHILRIKPLARDVLFSHIKNAPLVCTVEEHSLCGGLKSLVCDLMVEKETLVPFLGIGLNDTFSKGYSNTAHGLRAENGLDAASIAKAIMERK